MITEASELLIQGLKLLLNQISGFTLHLDV